MVRKIIHADLDAFYASVEQRDRPELKGKPVIVCGFHGGRGVVATASYEARKFGIRSAMPYWKARKLCPGGWFVAPDFYKYKQTSQAVHKVFRLFTDLIEPLSLDEAYLDVTNNSLGWYASKIARNIRSEVLRTTGLTISVGVAPNKLVAKIASDYQKPDGLTVVVPEKVEEFLHDLPIRKIPGIGPVTEARCWGCNIRKVKDFLKYDPESLEQLLGSSGPTYHEYAQGIDNRPVITERVRKSMGIEDTLYNDIYEPESARKFLRGLCQQLEEKLIANDISGRTVTLKMKHSNFKSITRQRTLPYAVNDWQSIWSIVCDLLRETKLITEGARLLGVSVSGLQHGLADPPPKQGYLFS